MKKNETDKRVTVDALKKLYLELKEKLIRPEEITEDITPIFWKGIRDKLEKKEQLKIVIQGQTTKGKSTAGCYIKWCINKIIQDQKIPTTYTTEEETEYDLIASNQIEFMRIARREDLHQVCCLIDEFSDMARSGANATTEEHLLEWYNKVCAQKYLHLIFCTPGNDYNKYGIIILDILDVDKEKGITKLKCYYNNPTDIRTQFLGYITIDITNILKKEWYKLYRQRKQFAMDLLLKESIKDVRELEFALVSLITYQKCIRLAQLGVKDTDIINTRVSMTIRETKAVYSLIAQNELISRVKGLITPIIMTRQKTEELNKERNKPLTQKRTDEIHEEIKIYEQESIELINIQKDLIKLYIQYASIGNKNTKKEILDLCEKYNIQIEKGSEKQNE